MMLKDDDCLKNTEIMKFQDLITKVPIFTKEEQERMSKEEFDRGTVISTGVQDWRKMFNKGELQR